MQHLLLSNNVQRLAGNRSIAEKTPMLASGNLQHIDKGLVQVKGDLVNVSKGADLAHGFGMETI